MCFIKILINVEQNAYWLIITKVLLSECWVFTEHLEHPENTRMMWPPNSPDLNPVDYCVWSALERNVYRGRRFENTIELKEAILQEWKALTQALINNAIDWFRSRVRLVIAENGQHIEKY